jgi:hypothetical protein
MGSHGPPTAAGLHRQEAPCNGGHLEAFSGWGVHRRSCPGVDDAAPGGGDALAPRTGAQTERASTIAVVLMTTGKCFRERIAGFVDSGDAEAVRAHWVALNHYDGEASWPQPVWLSPTAWLSCRTSGGWRSTSRTWRRHSGRASRKSMPQCANDTSPLPFAHGHCLGKTSPFPDQSKKFSFLGMDGKMDKPAVRSQTQTDYAEDHTASRRAMSSNSEAVLWR